MLNNKTTTMSNTQTVKERRTKLADSYSANGYGRGTNARAVYLIDGFAYAYHPEYAKQDMHPLEGELVGYVPVNIEPTFGKYFAIGVIDTHRAEPIEVKQAINRKEGIGS